MKTKPASTVAEIREHFLNVLADGEWAIDYDADTNSSGHLIDCSHFVLRVSLFSFKQLTEALGIEPKYMQSLDDAIQEAIEAEPKEICTMVLCHLGWDDETT